MTFAKTLCNPLAVQRYEVFHVNKRMCQLYSGLLSLSCAINFNTVPPPPKYYEDC